MSGPSHHRPDQGAAPPAGAGDGLCHAAVRILDNMQLGANEYRIRIKEFDSGKGELFPAAS
jgi:flagellar biosynthesis component FlhA